MLAEQRRDNVQTDDVLDALVAYVTASASAGQLRRLSGTPAQDQEGLPMEMLYLPMTD